MVQSWPTWIYDFVRPYLIYFGLIMHVPNHDYIIMTVMDLVRYIMYSLFLDLPLSTLIVVWCGEFSGSFYFHCWWRIQFQVVLCLYVFVCWFRLWVLVYMFQYSHFTCIVKFLLSLECISIRLVLYLNLQFFHTFYVGLVCVVPLEFAWIIDWDAISSTFMIQIDFSVFTSFVIFPFVFI